MTDTRTQSAFPIINDVGGLASEGMTLRQWYAGQALSGEVSANPHSQPDPKELAEFCFRVADAMIAAEQVSL